MKAERNSRSAYVLQPQKPPAMPVARGFYFVGEIAVQNGWNLP